jgi:hypothetical protein
MTIHFNASVLTADRVCYEFPVDCRLEGVDNVKRALDALCKMPRGCLATVGKGGRYESLSSALDALLNRGSGICICLLPGDHDVKDLLPNGGGTCSLHISGCGPGTRLLLTGGLKFSAFLSLHLIDMNILGQDDESRMDIEGSYEVVIRGCKISNSVTGSIPININDDQKILVEKNIINSYDIGRMPTYFKIFENFSKPIADLFFKPDRSNLGYNARSVAKALASSSKDNRLKLANGLDELMGLSKQEAKARYMFQEVMKKESVSSASIEAKLKDIFDTAAQINPVDAIIIGANSGDVTIADNEIFGNLRFYGKKVEPKEILDGIFNLLKERDIQFDDNVSMLQMRGNRLTGSMGIGEDVHAMLKGESLDGIFSQMIITDNVMESASMHILARDVRMTSNKLMTSSGQTYEALDETAIFLGNSAEEDMELKFVCRSKKKDLCICEHNLKIDFHCSYWE